jgi:PAS domain S-box-containing protein
VLHVDDDPEFGELVSAFLERENDLFEVTAATSAREGLARLGDGEFECVISDYQLAETDGLGFLRAVREEYRSLPFVLFTGRGSEEIAAEAITSGVTDYLQKGGPERYTVLANRVENAVDRYRTRRELDRTREWFRTLIENSTDATTVLDEEFVVTYQSPSIEFRFGYETDELLGRNAIGSVHPDDRERVRDALETFADSSEDVLEDLVYRFQHADGSWRWLASSLSDERDTIVDGFVVNSRDVTERRNQREWFQRLVEEAVDTIFVVGIGGEIEYAIPGVQELLGFEPEELVGQSGFDRIHPDDVTRTVTRFTEAVSEPEGRSSAVFRYRHADGSWIRLRGRVRNLLDDPIVGGLVVYVHEMTGSGSTGDEAFAELTRS